MKEKVSDIYPLTPMQEGMLLYSVMNPSSSAYFKQTTFYINDELNPDIVVKCLNEIISRYDILRTAFVHENTTKTFQVVLKNRNIEFEQYNIVGYNKVEKEDFIKKYKEKDKNLGFNLTKDILFRVTVIQTDIKEYVLLWSHHHIIMDGWCVSIILKEFNTLYKSSLENKPVKLPKVIQFNSYIKWLMAKDKEVAINFWKDYLHGFSQPSLLEDGIKISTEQYNRKVHFHILDRSLTKGMRNVISSEGLTLNTIIHAVWSIILKIYTGKNDVLFGYVVSGRPPEIRGIETMLGIFINTLPVRVNFNDVVSLKDLLKNLKENLLNCEPYHYFPLTEIWANSQLQRDFFDNFITFENLPRQQENSGYDQSLNINKIESYEQSSYNFNLIVHPSEEITLEFKFNANLYSFQFIETISKHFNEVAEILVNNLNYPVNDIKLSHNKEKVNVNLSDYSDTDFRI